MLSLSDGKNQTTKWNYDQFGRVTNKLDQAGTVVLKYFYDADDRLTNRWSTAKGTTYYTNDAVGNLLYIKYPVSTSVSLQYDALNRLTNMVDAAGTSKYTYTLGNQLLTEAQPFTSSVLTNTYVNRVRTSLSLQQPTGVWTNKFVYDAARRMTNVTSPAGSFAYTLGASSPGSTLIKKLLLPNTAYITNTFDSVGRLSGTFLDNSGNSTIDSAAYGYNLASQRTTFTNAAGTYVQYTYDRIGQLTVATSSVSSENRGYGFDSAWNLRYATNSVGGVTTYTLNSDNEATSDGTTTYTYDGNGNTASRNNSGGLLNYSYDDENRLTGLSLGSTYNTTFVYDGLGRLRRRIEITTSTTNDYLYDGNRVIQERVNGTPSVSYTRGPDLSTTMAGAGGIGGLLARSSGYSGGNWTTNYFYHADGNGNITYLMDSSQALAASYRYSPFGATLSSSGSLASANVYRFSSKEIHVNSGIYYFGYRFYDPSLLRWLNHDPIAEKGGLNLYRFCINRPTTILDPLGKDCRRGWDPDTTADQELQRAKDAAKLAAELAAAIVAGQAIAAAAPALAGWLGIGEATGVAPVVGPAVVLVPEGTTVGTGVVLATPVLIGETTTSITGTSLIGGGGGWGYFGPSFLGSASTSVGIWGPTTGASGGAGLVTTWLGFGF